MSEIAINAPQAAVRKSLLKGFLGGVSSIICLLPTHPFDTSKI